MRANIASLACAAIFVLAGIGAGHAANSVDLTASTAVGHAPEVVSAVRSQAQPQVGEGAVRVAAKTVLAPAIRSWEWRRLDRTPLAELTAGFSQFAAMGGTTLSIDISYIVDISEIADPAQRAAEEARYRSSLRSYLAVAAEAGLSVEAVAGSPHWIRPDVRYVTGIVADFVTTFNQASERKLAGLHYDLEPWGTPEWSVTARSQTRQLLETVAGIAALQAAVPVGQRVPVTVDLPFWLDGTTAPRSLRFGGFTMSPTAHVMRVLDNGAGMQNAVAIMAYRDQTGGIDGSLAVSAKEFRLAAKYNGRVRVIVGQEIGNVEPKRTTFHDEGLAAMRSAMRTLTTRYSRSVAWGGLAIDDFAALSGKF